MRFLRGLIDRLLLVAAVIAGGLVPGYIAQYRQRLGGRFDQAKLDLAPWQHIADQYHHGDLAQLIQYHLVSRDLTFHAEGSTIQALVQTVQRLQISVDALQTTLFRQIAYLSTHLDPELARATFNDWVPTFALSTEGLLFAVLFALLIWLLFHALWRLIAKAAPLIHFSGSARHGTK
jgi:Protein of unknown function (DUF2937)